MNTLSDLDELPDLGNWEDPYTKPVLETFNGFVVVRDDLLPAGSKTRFIDYLISHSSHVDEWVFGSSPRWGFGPISTAYVCRQYEKKFSLFLAESKEKHPNFRWVKEYGGKIIECPMGFLAVTEKRARDYVQGNSKKCLLPLGLEHPTVLASIVKVARNIGYTPKRFWTTGSSGTLNRGLQLAWPNAEAHVLQVGHTMKEREIGRAIVHTTDLRFSQHPKKQYLPPFPCVPEYEGKLWKLIEEEGRPGDLFWNVGRILT